MQALAAMGIVLFLLPHDLAGGAARAGTAPTRGRKFG